MVVAAPVTHMIPASGAGRFHCRMYLLGRIDIRTCGRDDTLGPRTRRRDRRTDTLPPGPQRGGKPSRLPNWTRSARPGGNRCRFT